MSIIKPSLTLRKTKKVGRQVDSKDALKIIKQFSVVFFIVFTFIFLLNSLILLTYIFTFSFPALVSCSLHYQSLNTLTSLPCI